MKPSSWPMKNSSFSPTPSAQEGGPKSLTFILQQTTSPKKDQWIVSRQYCMHQPEQDKYFWSFLRHSSSKKKSSFNSKNFKKCHLSPIFSLYSRLSQSTGENNWNVYIMHYPVEYLYCMELHFSHLPELFLLAHERKIHSEHPQMRRGLSLPSLWKQKVYLDTEKSSTLASDTTGTL